MNFPKTKDYYSFAHHCDSLAASEEISNLIVTRFVYSPVRYEVFTSYTDGAKISTISNNNALHPVNESSWVHRISTKKKQKKKLSCFFCGKRLLHFCA